MTNLQPTVARQFLRQLSGFRGYPRDAEGEGRFVEVLCEVALSVEHALAIIWAFEEHFPTIREIRDTAFSLRPKFEAKVDQRAGWEKEYGKPNPAWSRRISQVAGGSSGMDPKARGQQHADERRAMLWQGIRDSIFYTETSMGRADLASIDDKDGRIHAFKFWRQAAQRNQRDHPTEVAAFREELQSTGWDELMVYDWANGEFPHGRTQSSGTVAVLERPITQSDIDIELQKAGRESGDGE